MAQIQQGAVTGLALIARHNRRFGAAAARHRFGHSRLIKSQHFFAVFFEPSEKRFIAKRPIFDNLGITGTHFARRQGFQHIHIGQHQIGLVKRADEVFAAWRINRGFAAN